MHNYIPNLPYPPLRYPTGMVWGGFECFVGFLWIHKIDI